MKARSLWPTENRLPDRTRRDPGGLLKVSVLKAMAPQQTEPSFVVTQRVMLVLSVPLTVVAAKRLYSEPVARV